MKKALILLLGLLPFWNFGQECENSVMRFDGSSDHLRTASPITGNPDFTLEFWFKSESAVNASEVTKTFVSWEGLHFSDINRRLEIVDDFFNGRVYIKPFPDTDIRDGNWHHFAYSKSGDEVTMLLDNTTYGYTTGASSPFDLNDRLIMGRHSFSSSAVYIGLIDEVRIWNYARSIDEITAERDCELTAKEEGLLLYYDFNLGVPGGNNRAITHIPNLASCGDYNASISNFSMNGEASNIVCVDDSPVQNCNREEIVNNRNCGEAVITCFPGYNGSVSKTNPVLGIVDIRDQSSAQVGRYWEEASGDNIHHPAHWNFENLGLVFGLAIDSKDNIYTTATTVYGCESMLDESPFGPAGAAGIYKIKPNNEIVNFITTGEFVSGGTQIPNDGSGLGNICYDPDHNQLFVTNFADGMIYRVCLNTERVVDRFDPFTTNNIRSDENEDFVALGERTWGIGYYNNRIYFGRWNEDIGRPNPELFNEIWSLSIDPISGSFGFGCQDATCSGGEILEISIPDQVDVSSESGIRGFSNPISDIAFSNDGQMLVSERSIRSDCGYSNPTNVWTIYTWYAHNSRVLEYELKNAEWFLTEGQILDSHSNELKFEVGQGRHRGSNSSGGIDYGYKSFGNENPSTNTLLCDQMVWMSGDYLQSSQESGKMLYGLQGINRGGGNSNNGFVVDFDGKYNDTNQKNQQGDVEIFKCGCYEFTIKCEELVVENLDLQEDDCCYSYNISNTSNEEIIRVEAEILTNEWIFVEGSVNVNGGILLSENSTPKKVILEGKNIDVTSGELDFCIDTLNVEEVPSESQQIVFKWYQRIGEGEDCDIVVCTDTVTLECNPVDREDCIDIENIVIEPDAANPFDYIVTFDVTNNSGVPSYFVTLSSLSSDFTFSDCNGGFSDEHLAIVPDPRPLEVGNTTTLCTKIRSRYIVNDPTDFCFIIGTFFNEGQLCFNTENICINLNPSCKNPCQDKSVTTQAISNPQNDCCYQLELDGGCGIFSAIEVSSLTDGVVLGNVEITNTDFYIFPDSTDTDFRLTYGEGTIPSEINREAVQFCLNGTVQEANEVEVRWMAQTARGEEILCRDTLQLKCPTELDPCDQLTIQTDTIRCLEDNTIDLVFTITNNSSTLFEVIDFYDDLNDEVLISIAANLGEGESYVFTHNVDPEQDTLFCLKAFTFNFEENLCCHLEECVELEPCMDCEMVSVSSEPLGDKEEQCCHSLTLENNNGDFYSQAVATINTAGVVFSDVIPHMGVNLSGGNGTNSITMDMSGSIPMGSNLFVDFCLDGVVYEEQMEQEVVVEWYGIPDEAGNMEVICTDTLTYTCADCAVVRNQEFQCTLPVKTLAFELVDLPDEPYANYIRVDVIEPINIGFGENCAPVYEEVLADETTFFELPVQTCEGGFTPIGTVKYRITIFNDTTGVCCVLDTLSFRIIPCPSPVNFSEDKNDDLEDMMSINIQPNPSTGKTNVEVNMVEASSASLSILDLNGKLVFEQTYQLDEGINQIPLDLKALSNGLYHYQIKTKDHTLLKPLVILK
ncbi:MAG: LamG-like jellyroll fold domain-containing protein [Bacteroidota bacterium]